MEDAAEGILLATEHYDESEPVNLGSGQEITIRALVEMIARLSGFEGKVVGYHQTKWSATPEPGHESGTPALWFQGPDGARRGVEADNRLVCSATAQKRKLI